MAMRIDSEESAREVGREQAVSAAWYFERESADYPLLRLLAIEEAIRYLESERRAVVRVARERGASWGEVGWALGVSKQAAAKKYGPFIG